MSGDPDDGGQGGGKDRSDEASRTGGDTGIDDGDQPLESDHVAVSQDDGIGGEGAAGDDGDIPSIEELTGGEQRLHPAVQVVWILRSGMGALAVGITVGIAGVLLGPVLWPGPVALTVAFGLAVGHALIRYRRWRYEVRADVLYLDRGVITHVTTVVPHVRIQHVDTARGPLERILGLSSVVVYTAGSRGADVTVPGLPPQQATDLQERLKGLAIAAEGEDAV